MCSFQWHLGTVGKHPSICSNTHGNQGKPNTRWPVTGLSGTDCQPAFRHLTEKEKTEVVRLQVDNNYIIQVRTAVQNGITANRNTLNIHSTLCTTTTVHYVCQHIFHLAPHHKTFFGSLSLYLFHSHFYHFAHLPSISTLCPICPPLPHSTFRHASPDHLTSLTDCH